MRLADCPAAAAAGPGGLPFLQQQQSVAARKEHNRCRAARFNHHSLNRTTLALREALSPRALWSGIFKREIVVCFLVRCGVILIYY
jgi:hypothetical protein